MHPVIYTLSFLDRCKLFVYAVSRFAAFAWRKQAEIGLGIHCYPGDRFSMKYEISICFGGRPYAEAANLGLRAQQLKVHDIKVGEYV